MASDRLQLLKQIDDLANQPVQYDVLKSIYENTAEIAHNDASWYQKRQRRWRGGTRVIKVITYLTLAIGVILPLWPNNAAYLHYGYVSLVIGGLVYSADQVFLFSKSWVRYIQAEMQIRQLLLQFHYQWYIDRVAISPDQPVDTQQAQGILTGFKAFIESVHQVIAQETKTWETEINDSMTQLGSQLQAKTDELDSKIKALETKSGPADAGTS